MGVCLSFGGCTLVGGTIGFTTGSYHSVPTGAAHDVESCRDVRLEVTASDGDRYAIDAKLIKADEDGLSVELADGRRVDSPWNRVHEMRCRDGNYLWVGAALGLLVDVTVTALALRQINAQD